MVALIPVLICVVGVLLYALTDGKLSEIGRIAFLCGLLVALAIFSHARVSLP